ncbi:hypothetical protein ACFRIC_01125 [Streptomyces sp. NPDC056738]|uniref:hypothetical protein n=1 Tax=Streptomyces sp. NPDC056738 TaxID=3345933 RepID=UPI0036997491
MQNELTHEDSTFINFRHYKFADSGSHAFRWVDIKRLRLPAESVEDRALLATLIAHEQFRDDYAGGGVQPEGLRHGPYWLSAMAPEVYESVGRETSDRILREWANQFGDAPAALAADLERAVFERLAAAERIYHLRELGEESFHDWGGVHTEFHEFVLIDRSAGQITLLVAADD